MFQVKFRVAQPVVPAADQTIPPTADPNSSNGTIGDIAAKVY
jgi:hypothetical protein